MKIAIFVHCFYPRHMYGTEAYTLTLAKNLTKIGHDVTVVTTVFQGEPSQERPIESYIWDGVKVVSIDRNIFPHHSLAETFYAPKFREAQERIIRGINPDIIHVTHLINHTASIIEVSKALNIPVFFTLTDFFGFCFNNKLETASGGLCDGPDKLRSNCLECYLKDVSEPQWASPANIKYRNPAYRKVTAKHAAWKGKLSPHKINSDFRAIIDRPNILRSHYKSISAALAPSSFLMKAYRDNIPELPLKLSHFGIDIDRGRKPTRKNDEPIVFGFIGQIAPHKGTHLLIKAFSRLSDRCRLEIYGSPNQNKSYFSMLQEISLGLNVVFKGTFSRSETVRILGDIDVMVIPSTWYENSPLILLQSLATHTPCIVSNVEGMTEFVEEGTNGFHFTRGSEEDLYVKMQNFVSDRFLAQRLSLTTSYERTAFDMARDVDKMYSDYVS